MSDLAKSTPITTDNHSTTILGLPFDAFSLTFAFLVSAGGIMGYIKAKSIPSLTAGMTFGALVGVGSYLEATQDNYWLTFASSGILGSIMGRRYLNSKKFMPAGLITALSLGMVIRYSIRTYQLTRESKP